MGRNQSVYVGHEALDGLGVKISKLYNTLSNPTCIIMISQICCISTTVADFRLPHRNYKFLTSSWFHASLTQVVNKSCITFNLMWSLPIMLKSHISHILQALKQLITVQGRQKEIKKDEQERAIVCVANCKKMVVDIIDKFSGLMQLIKELIESITVLESAKQIIIDALRNSVVVLCEVKHNIEESFATLINTRETELYSLLKFVDSIDYEYQKKTVRLKDVSNFYLDILVRLDEMLTITDTQDLKTKEAEVQKICSKFDSKPTVEVMKIRLRIAVPIASDLARQLIFAPKSIISLGQLCLISGTAPDIELPKPQWEQYKEFRYLTSTWFRAGLHQVVNDASAAVSLADKKMTEIGVPTKMISKSILDAARLIVDGKAGEVASNRSSLLMNLKETVDACKTAVREVEERFEYLMELIRELSEAITACRSQLERMGHTELKVIVDGLMEGLKVLSRIKQQWQLLVEFFNKLYSSIKESINTLVSEFIMSVDQILDRKEKEGKVSDFVRKSLQRQASEIATKVAHVSLVATLYLDISHNHLVDYLATLDSLLTFTDPAELERIARDMSEKCENSRAQIAVQTFRSIEDAGKNTRKIFGLRVGPPRKNDIMPAKETFFHFWQVES